MAFGLILRFLGKYWHWILLALVVAGVYFHYTGLVKERNAYRDQVVKLQASLEICNSNVNKLEGEITKVNTAIDKLSSVTATQTNKFDTLRRDVNNKTSSIKTDVQAILKGQKPQTCDDAIKYLIDAKKEYETK